MISVKKGKYERAMIEEILHWARIITDAGGGRIKFVCPALQEKGTPKYQRPQPVKK